MKALTHRDTGLVCKDLVMDGDYVRDLNQQVTQHDQVTMQDQEHTRELWVKCAASDLRKLFMNDHPYRFWNHMIKPVLMTA